MQAADRPPLATLLRHAAGVAELTGHVGAEIATLVQEVHAACSPVARLGGAAPAPAVYGPIRLGFAGARQLGALAGRLAPREAPADAWLDVQSALNGAFGHRLAATGGFALPMSLVRPAPARAGAPLLVFLHGLCMNERCWRRPAHERFVAWARERLDADVAYLRYHTGLRISHNAALLDALLERTVPAGEVVLVGHSMGGLVALGALHRARERGSAWADRVRRVACLGSPHEGASLERLGNHANRLLAASPWTRPFMRLGNLRSDGIRDLRFGHVLEQDWRGRARDDARPTPSGVALGATVDHLFVAASRSARGEGEPFGDWLVPVSSALARRLHPPHAARRALIPALDHMGLLGDHRVYRLLRSWLEGGDGAGFAAR